MLGIFQAGMTVIGYTMGLGFEKYICAFDHWIAFTLLLYLGGKMIYDSTKEEEEDGKFDPLCNRTLCGLGIATSIDALAVGISLAILKSPLLLQASTIRQENRLEAGPHRRFNLNRYRYKNFNRAFIL